MSIARKRNKYRYKNDDVSSKKNEQGGDRERESIRQTVRGKKKVYIIPGGSKSQYQNQSAENIKKCQNIAFKKM